MDIDELLIGMSESYSQTITDADIKAFAGLSGDRNPVHMSDSYAKETIYGRRIAHGMISAGFFSAIFGTRLPGPGCVYLSQSLTFRKPVYVGDTITAIVTLEKVSKTRRIAFFDTSCFVDGIKVISGHAEILIS